MKLRANADPHCGAVSQAVVYGMSGRLPIDYR